MKRAKLQTLSAAALKTAGDYLGVEIPLNHLSYFTDGGSSTEDILLMRDYLVETLVDFDHPTPYSFILEELSKDNDASIDDDTIKEMLIKVNLFFIFEFVLVTQS